MSILRILAALKSGPKTNAQLQDLCEDHGGGIARTCARLRKEGRVRRVDGGAGRRSIAVYALTDAVWTSPITADRKKHLAELMADGCPTLAEAARRMLITVAEANSAWRAIRRDLGGQAA